MPGNNNELDEDNKMNVHCWGAVVSCVTSGFPVAKTTFFRVEHVLHCNTAFVGRVLPTTKYICLLLSSAMLAEKGSCPDEGNIGTMDNMLRPSC